MTMPMQGQDAHGDRPEPKSLFEALHRDNRTLAQILHTCELIEHCPNVEYDQDDVIGVEYDAAFDLARAFRTVAALARRQERVMRHALELHGPQHPAHAVLTAALQEQSSGS